MLPVVRAGKPILVSGVTGQIGGELAKLLAGAGAYVVGLNWRDPSKAGAALDGVRLVQGDFDHPSSLGACIRRRGPSLLW